MRASRELAEHLAEMLAPVGGVELKAMFGGFSLRAGGVPFAIAIDTLYLRVGTMSGSAASHTRRGRGPAQAPARCRRS